MDAKSGLKEEIETGAHLCRTIKRLLFADKAWVKCNKEVGAKFAELKKRAKDFYPDKSMRDILSELNKYSDTDILDCFGVFHVEPSRKEVTNGY